MDEKDLLSKGPSEKLKIQKSAVKGTFDKITKFFREYRELMNTLKSSREPFFKVLKVEFLKSINESEKLEILEDIQRSLSVQSTNQMIYNSYPYRNNSNNQCISQYINITAPSNNQEIVILPSNEYQSTSQCGNDCSTSSYDDNHISNLSPFSEYLHQNGITDDSKENENTAHQTYNNLFYDQNPTDCDHHTNFNSSANQYSKESNISIVETLFSQISSVVETNGNVVQELETCQEQYGNDVYRHLMGYIPKSYNRSIQKIKEEPLIFQLASKYQQFNVAFRKLLENELLILDTKNHNNISLFNFLLAKDISLLYGFLKFIRDLGLTIKVERICQEDSGFRDTLIQKKKSFLRDSAMKTKLESIERFCLNPRHA